ncbi:MAG: sigma-54-dependent transcriptional regulator [Thermodesulfobacteriota bacterium]
MAVTNAHILVVDDDTTFSHRLKAQLEDIGEVTCVASEAEFRKVFSPYRFDLIFLDLRLRQWKEGLDVLDFIIQEDPSAIVIVISGYGDIATAVESLQKGAKTFLEKDRISMQEIRLRAEHALTETLQERRIRQLEKDREEDAIIGNDLKIQDIRGLISLVGKDGETNVLIRGETGTGKELVARAIHSLGIRRENPFIAVALTDNPETITSELFGHEKGAFTGAVNRHFGYFEQAHKGVLFMDEIGDLSPDIQNKLLRVLDHKTFRRMGGKSDIKVDVQVVTATNRPLEDMVKDGRFRRDLYYRLKVFEIYLPPLRERKIDIPLLADHFLTLLRRKGRTNARGFAADAIDLMMLNPWPGNVRELKSAVEGAALRCRLDGSLQAKRKHIEPFIVTTHKSADTKWPTDVLRTLAETELAMINEALRMTNGKKTEVIKILNYPNRFSMLRRVRRISTQYPGILESYPEIRKSYL